MNPTPIVNGRESREERRLSIAAVLFLCAFPAFLTVGCDDGKPPAPAEDAGAAGCAWDEANGPEAAAALASGTAAAGFLCPVEDVDWYAFETGAGNGLLRIALKMETPLSSVEPTYTVWARNVDGSAGEVVVPPPSVQTGVALDDVHCVAPGNYFLTVRDNGNDGQDERHGYALTVSAAPDPDGNEPNDGEADYVPVPAGGAAFTGFVACKGDEDWYAADLPGRKLINIGLDAGAGRVAFAVKVVSASGETLAAVSKEGTAADPTSIRRRVAAVAAGVYYIVVSDNDGADADPGLAYQLSVGIEDDLDANEPNDHPGTAAPLSGATVACGDEWSAWMEMNGTVGAAGDADWFRLPLSGCVRGLIEAEVTFDTAGMDAATAWEFQQTVQAAISVVRAHDTSPCASDPECRLLKRQCRNGWDCSGIFSACLEEGYCAGATVCLPEKTCGATLVEGHYASAAVPAEITGPPPPDAAVVSAPFYTIDLLYVKVSDYQGDGEAPQVPYALRVRVRNDPDLNEPSNPFYAPDLLETTDIAPQQVKAVTIPVHDCTASECCDGGTWVEGAVSYRNDVDWYRYQHPCPGRDCMVRILYELEGGPVDFLFEVFRQTTLWFDTVVPVSESSAQAAQDGTFGGLAAADQCFYSYQGHRGSKGCQAGEQCVVSECLTPAGTCATDGDCQSGFACHAGLCVGSSGACEKHEDCPEGERCFTKQCVVSSGDCSPFFYFVAVRDFAQVRDWESDQGYRFCVEKVAEGCHGGEVCRSKQCVETLYNCGDAEDCPSGLACASRSCVQSSGACETDAECTDGNVCIGKNCVVPHGACAATTDCAIGPCVLYDNGCGPRP
ncbi:MAG: hypothetical protein HY897_05535 [Deltaproteobacteria bacterium]|nr:hypothetical protein [Deltaproteobacteria bacterium]